MSDLVGNPEDRFSHNEAHTISEYAPTTVRQTQEKCAFVVCACLKQVFSCRWSFKILNMYIFHGMCAEISGETPSVALVPTGTSPILHYDIPPHSIC